MASSSHPPLISTTSDRLDDQALYAVIETLRFGSFHDRWEGAKQVAELGDDAVAELLAVLHDTNASWETRWFAARSLGSFNSPEVISGLIQAFTYTRDHELHQAIGKALTTIGQPAIGALAQLLDEPCHSSVAVQALAQIQHPDTILPLLRGLDQRQGEIRAIAIAAVAQFNDPMVLPAICQSLDDPSPQVRLAALDGLVNLRSQVDPHHWVAWLAPRLKDASLTVAQRAAHGLGRSTLPAATQALLAVLRQATTLGPLRIAATRALCWQATPQALAGIVSAWPTASVDLRLVMVQGLSLITAPDLHPQVMMYFVNWLESLPTTADQSVLRRQLVTAMGQVGQTRAVPYLRLWLGDADDGVRLHAEAALRQWA
ncbi:HEAT repeat domain-containing protein [Nodosilinea sp. P-1105]|uniref:HEAT repeat domain-containing protein n=1 Tax=Nodosilinea sp. P-1105 TaxID=2546229 RepID=UPI00146C4FF7|nr:HEAT repeat domain-containing protein [Nodosilinea sp. P-1105]